MKPFVGSFSMSWLTSVNLIDWHFHLLVRPKHLRLEAQSIRYNSDDNFFRMSSDQSLRSTRKWSCSTLQDGVDCLMHHVMDAEERESIPYEVLMICKYETYAHLDNIVHFITEIYTCIYTIHIYTAMYWNLENAAIFQEIVWYILCDAF